MTVTDPRRGDADPTQGRDVTAADFRHAIGHFATGVTVVTTVGADGQPVGTVHIAVSNPGDTVVRTLVLAGDRQGIRTLTVEAVLSLLLSKLEEENR